MYSITEMDDRELFSKLQQGDGKAFEAIYEKYHRLLYAFALRHLESRDMAEDAVQQVFVHLWEIHTDIYVNISLRNYLYTMIKNHILNLIRSENTTFVRNYELAEAKQDYCEDLDDKIDKKEQMAMLYKAIASLPEQKRVVCMLKMEQ
jgi:RNA polymerase sigma factor (sigma-70 family)